MRILLVILLVGRTKKTNEKKEKKKNQPLILDRDGVATAALPSSTPLASIVTSVAVIPGTALILLPVAWLLVFWFTEQVESTAMMPEQIEDAITRWADAMWFVPSEVQ